MTQESMLKTDIEAVQKMAKRIDKEFQSAKRIDYASQEIFSQKLLAAISLCEKLSIRARELPVLLPNQNAGQEIVEHLDEDVQVKFFSEPGGIEIIEIPQLLIRKTKLSVNYIRSRYYRPIKKRFQDRTGPMQEKAVVWIEFVYSHRYKENHIKDYDNTEKKPIIDLLTPFLLQDDSPKYYKLFESASVGEKSKTIIRVIPETQFVAYLTQINTKDS